MRRAGVSPPSTVTPVATCVSPKRDNHGWVSFSDDDDHYNSRRVPTPWVSSSSEPPPPLDERILTTPTVHQPPGIQSPPAFDADGSLTGFRRVDCPLRLRVDEAVSSYREDDRDWCDAWRTHQLCSSSRLSDCEPAPECLAQSFRQSLGPALQSDQRSRRQTDELQILS